MANLLTDAELKANVQSYISAYAPGRPLNPNSKSYKEFTSAEIAQLPNEILGLLRYMMNEEKYSITDPIMPDAMSRADFKRTILREATKRGIASQQYNHFSPDDPKLQNKTVTVERFPFGGSVESKAKMVSAPADVMAIHDAAVDILVNNPKGLRLMSDVAAQVGITGGRALPLDNDAEAYDFGYVAGSFPQFKRGNDLQISPRILPTAEQQAVINTEIAKMTKGKTDAEIEAMRSSIQTVVTNMTNAYAQNNYCSSVDMLYREGSAHDNKTAMLLGFAQARIDGNSNFQGLEDHVGLFGGACPASKKSLGR